MRTDKDDPRGMTFRVRIGPTAYQILHLELHGLRGGHYHTKPVDHLVLQGRITFYLVDIRTMERQEIPAAPFETVEVPAYVAHLLEADEDSIFMEPEDKGGTYYYQPQRSQIRARHPTVIDKDPIKTP